MAKKKRKRGPRRRKKNSSSSNRQGSSPPASSPNKTQTTREELLAHLDSTLPIVGKDGAPLTAEQMAKVQAQLADPEYTVVEVDPEEDQTVFVEGPEGQKVLVDPDPEQEMPILTEQEAMAQYLGAPLTQDQSQPKVTGRSRARKKSSKATSRPQMNSTSSSEDGRQPRHVPIAVFEELERERDAIKQHCQDLVRQNKEDAIKGAKALKYLEQQLTRARQEAEFWKTKLDEAEFPPRAENPNL